MASTSPNVKAVVELFMTSLAEVKFGDVDAQSLARASSAVESAAIVVASARTALDAANSTLREREEALLLHAHCALAYARVYAENDETVSAQLAAISLPRGPRRSHEGRSETHEATTNVQPANRVSVRAKRIAPDRPESVRRSRRRPSRVIDAQR